MSGVLFEQYPGNSVFNTHATVFVMPQRDILLMYAGSQPWTELLTELNKQNTNKIKVFFEKCSFLANLETFEEFLGYCQNVLEQCKCF